MKFVTKLPGKIGESLHVELVKWFKDKHKEGFAYHATLLPVIEYVEI